MGIQYTCQKFLVNSFSIRAFCTFWNASKVSKLLLNYSNQFYQNLRSNFPNNNLVKYAQITPQYRGLNLKN